MSNFSQYLNQDQQRQIIEQRLVQFAAEGYQHELNKSLALATNDEALLQTSEDAISKISAAIIAHEEQLQNLA